MMLVVFGCTCSPWIAACWVGVRPGMYTIRALIGLNLTSCDTMWLTMRTIAHRSDYAPMMLRGSGRSSAENVLTRSGNDNDSAVVANVTCSYSWTM